MKHSKDLNWLSAPAFFLIIGIIAFHSINQNNRTRHQEKVKPPIITLSARK